MFEVTFLRQYVSTIISLCQIRIFCVNDAKTQPRLNTVNNPNGKMLYLEGIVQRERSGAIFKPFLDAQSSTSKAHKPLRQSLSLPMSRSKSMEGISSLAPTTKFTLRPQMILDAAKRIGQGSKESSEKSLDLLPTEKKKKPRPLKKIFKESTIPVLDSRGKRQKHSAVDMDVGVSRVTALAPDEPCTVSDMDQPSNLDERSHEEGASSGTDLQCPLSDSILALLCELLKDRGSWLTVDRVQQGFSGSLGGLLEWYEIVILSSMVHYKFLFKFVYGQAASTLVPRGCAARPSRALPIYCDLKEE